MIVGLHLVKREGDCPGGKYPGEYVWGDMARGNVRIRNMMDMDRGSWTEWA